MIKNLWIWQAADVTRIINGHWYEMLHVWLPV